MVKLSPESALKVRDGTVVVGQNANDTIFTTPEDAGRVDILLADKLIQKFNAENAYGHNDWRLPNDDEREVLIGLADEKALRNTFNTCHWPNRKLSNCYLSSQDLTRFSDRPEPQNEMILLEAKDGYREYAYKKSGVQFFIRPVRNGPMPV
jgi:hypothetical protein